MAQYRVGPEGYYRDGVRYYAGDSVVRPDDEKPSHTFFPLDAPARKAMEKHYPDGRWKREPKPPRQVEMPSTMSEMQRGKSTRPSDHEPV